MFVVRPAVFSGVSLAGLASGTIVRVMLHIEGKLLDGSTVHTSEREYLFQICSTAGCGMAGPWAIDVNGTRRSCL